jgi:hypothetical protein
MRPEQLKAKCVAGNVSGVLTLAKHFGERLTHSSLLSIIGLPQAIRP